VLVLVVDVVKRPKRFWLGLVFILIPAAGWFFWHGCRSVPGFPEERLTRLARGDIARSVVAVGQIEPRSKVEVKSKANGIILNLLADVGDRVRREQVETSGLTNCEPP